MARNRKYRTVAARFGPAIKAFVLCLIIGGSGVGYVWQKNQIFELGRQIKDRETRLRTLNQQNGKMKTQLADMTTVEFLEGKIRDMKLGLAAPALSQIWRLPEPQREPVPAPPADPQYALHEARGSP
jgi:hypothetical protein